jgi:hypothetical protein
MVRLRNKATITGLDGVDEEAEAFSRPGIVGFPDQNSQGGAFH